MTTPHRTCAVASCSAEVGARTPFCRRHWDVLPGKLRSRISMAATGRNTDVRQSEIDRGVRLIGMMA